mmetsp:Transcript_12216/g.25680  ORF Transcript_12216/g.25680 Transcript_12216/m.25680 type:complete len:419 (-) Transcript_12216:96-1352(-)
MYLGMIWLRALVLCWAASRSLAQPVIKNSDTTQDYLSRYGIPVEEHFVHTEDGYILKAFRLPQNTSSPVVMLQHGILASSWCWLVNTEDKSLAISLWQMGYDVWLPNSRGNTFSRNHTKLKPFLNKQFWNFTFDDMATFDVVANIRYALNVSAKATLSFVGWSQGSTQMFIAAQDKHKDFLDLHVNLFIALSPVTYLKHQSSLLLAVAKDFRLGVLLDAMFPYDVFSWAELPTIGSWLCKITFEKICTITVDVVCGSSQHDNGKAITNLAAHFPAGTSVKDFDHFEQFLISDRFGRFDYGRARNIKHYGMPTPPSYNVSALKMPTALFRGSEDTLADPADVQHLLHDLRDNKNVVFSKEYTGYSHVTWMVGLDDEWIVDLKKLLKDFNPIAIEPAKGPLTPLGPLGPAGAVEVASIVV